MSGVPGQRRFPPAQVAEVLRRYSAGESATALGREYGCATHTVVRLVREAGIHRPYAEARKLHSDLHDPPLTEAIIGEILARYAEGEALHRIAKAYGWRGHSAQRLTKALRARGVELRGRAEATRLATQNDDLAEMSRDAWWALYWSPESRYPQVNEIAARLGVAHGTVTRYLRRHGLAVRSSAMQRSLDQRLGRSRTFPGNPHGTPRNIQFAIASNRGRKWKPESVRRAAFKRRRRVQAPCAWCGRMLERVRSAARERMYCGPRCGMSHFWWERRFPDLGRPLLVQRLRERLGGNPPTWANLEKLCPEIGAGEREILAVLGLD